MFSSLLAALTILFALRRTEGKANSLIATTRMLSLSASAICHQSRAKTDGKRVYHDSSGIAQVKVRTNVTEGCHS
jgi:hypothetical protein